MADGAVLPLRRWLPQGDTRAIVVALHGMNDYSNFFAEPGGISGPPRHRQLCL